MEVKDNSKRSAVQNNRLVLSKAGNIYSYRNNDIRVPRKKNAINGVLPSCKQHRKKTHYHDSAQRYYILCKKVGINDCKRKSNISENSS